MTRDTTRAHVSGNVSRRMPLLALLSTLGLLSFSIFLAAQFILIERIWDKYPDLYKRLGRPWPFWSGPRNFQFGIRFILARKFTDESLDSNTNHWCNVASISLSLFFMVVFGVVLWTVSF